MSTLYNCHSEGSQYRITKFDELGNVESTYLCTTTSCECPAGHRPSCRHRHMLPRFIAKDAVNSFYFYDYDRQGWVMTDSTTMLQQDLIASAAEHAHNITATEIDERMSKLQAPQVDVSDM